MGCGHATDCSRCGSLHPARFDDLRGSAAASCRSAHLGSSTAFLSARASFLSARTAFLSARTALLSTRTVYGTTFRRTERGASGIASCGPLPRHTGNHCSAHFYAAPRSLGDAGRAWRNCRPRSGRGEPPSTNRVAADASHTDLAESDLRQFVVAQPRNSVFEPIDLPRQFCAVGFGG